MMAGLPLDVLAKLAVRAQIVDGRLERLARFT